MWKRQVWRKRQSLKTVLKLQHQLMPMQFSGYALTVNFAFLLMVARFSQKHMRCRRQQDVPPEISGGMQPQLDLMENIFLCCLSSFHCSIIYTDCSKIIRNCYHRNLQFQGELANVLHRLKNNVIKYRKKPLNNCCLPGN